MILDNVARDERDEVVVPWAPGNVVRVTPTAPSDVDTVLDELFGPPDTGGPGWFDAALVVAGAVLLVRGLVALGAIAVVLGLALPLRSVVRRVKRAGQRRTYRAVLASGQPLATGHPATDALVAAYDGLLAAAAHVAEWLRDEAVEAGHRALVECASLLGGHVPVTEEETAYVSRRTEAIRAAAVALSASQPRPDRVAAVRAREELDATSGTTSLDNLRAVARQAGS